MGIARPEHVASRIMEREGRALAWKAAEQLDLVLDALASDREQELLRELGEQHWRFEPSHVATSFDRWARLLSYHFWRAVLRCDADALPEGGDPAGTREPRRPRPSAGSMAAAAEPPDADELVHAVAA